MGSKYLHAIRTAGSFPGCLDVYTTEGVIEGVNANVVRCILGSDYEDALRLPTNGGLNRQLTSDDLNELLDKSEG